MASLNIAENGGKSVCYSQADFEAWLFWKEDFLSRHGGFPGADRWPSLGDTSFHECFLHPRKVAGPSGCLEHPYRPTSRLAAFSLILTSVCPDCLLPAYLGTREVCDMENRSCEEGLEELHALRWLRLTEVVKKGDKCML